MKQVRNPKLRRILNAEGIKDVYIEFDNGLARAYSDDPFTNDVLSYSTVESEYVMSFNQSSVEEWADYVRNAFDSGLEIYELQHKGGIGDSRRVKDAVMTIKNQERQLLENGVITKTKLNELIGKFKSKYDEIPINIDIHDYNKTEWERIVVGVEIGDTELEVDYHYAGHIDTETGEVFLELDDGVSWIYEYDDYRGWKPTSNEHACHSFMSHQERDFMEAIRSGFDEYVRKNYKKYFKKNG